MTITRLIYSSSWRSAPAPQLCSRSASARVATGPLLHGLTDLCRCVRHARHLVLAVRDSLFHRHRGGRSAASLALMFWGAGLFVFPLMLIYTAISYDVFRGKVRPASVTIRPVRNAEVA